MKELTPNGWIEVLIGIFVLGIIAGHVAGQNKCFSKTLKVVDTVEELKDAFTSANWKETCDATTPNCLQYFPKSASGPSDGIVLGSTECGTECPAAGDAATKPKVKNAVGYECFKCTVSDTCKPSTVITKTECYSSYEPAGSVTNVKKVKKVYCFDACNYKEIEKAGVKKLFVGCAGLCNVENGGACTVCNSLADCEKLILAPTMCHAKTPSTNLETVTKITDAYKIENWKEKCDANQVCLQYFPIKHDGLNDNTKGTGKVSLQVQCGDSSSCNLNSAVTKLGKGYDCHACHSRDSGSCKEANTITNSGVKECHEFDNEKQTGDIASIPKIYCFDACQYKETGTKVKVNCAKDNAGGTDCPATTDPSCAKMIFKPTDSGGNQATTTRPKTSNKLTTSKYLLGSLAILLFATNQYMRQF